jgi:hypothetical protein
LAAFSAFAKGSPPNHPSRPSLSQELDFAQNLQERNPATLDSIEGVLDQKDEAAEAALDPQSQRTIDELIEAAKVFDAEALSNKPMKRSPQ